MTTPTTLKPATFAPQTTFEVGSYPRSIAISDFNNDGVLDIATANVSSNNVSVLLGNGDGNFAPQANFNVGGWSTSICVGDFNVDGKKDLAVANASDNNVSVLLGDGKGSFSSQTNFAVGGYSPQFIDIGDFNSDGKIDLVTANNSSDNISILLGDGLGKFGAATTFAVDRAPNSMGIGDFNHDGYSDIATANYPNSISVLLGNGQGGFAPQASFSTGNYLPQSISIGDLNSDGNVDLITANSEVDSISMLLGNGYGDFSTPNLLTVGHRPISTSIGDFNADGKIDLATANWGDNTVSVLLGNENGSFTISDTLKVGHYVYSINLGDFNSDGKMDIVTTNDDEGTISVLLNTTAKTSTVIPPVVSNNPPTGNVTISGVAQQNQTLMATNTLQDENGLGAFSYQWLQNGKAISGATKATYTLSADDIGTAISVKVGYTDGLKKLETATSSATALIEPKPEEVLPPTYALTVNKTNVNEGDTVTFNLTTENVEDGTEIPFKFGGTISNADVLGGLKTSRFVVDSNGKSSLAVKFLADKLTEGAENLTLTLNSGENQSVAVKDTSLTLVIVKPVTETPTVSKGYDKKAVILSGDKLIGGEKNDTLTGNVGKDELLGKAGNDKLIGLGGNDTLIGESGNDDLSGGEGLDSLSGSSGNDLLDGGNGNDTLIGDQGNDTLKGGFGVDNMDGGDGDDYYFVDNSRDVVSESNKNGIGGNDTIESTSTYTLGKNIENLVLAGIDNNAGKGNELNNQITGNIGDNKLEGMAGNDKLLGKDGADTLDGGKGTDTLIGGNDDDIYIINNDFDTVIEEKNGGAQDQIRASVDYDLSRSLFVEVLTLSGAAVTGVGDEASNLLMEIDNGKVANHFVGNDGNDTILSEDGNDTIEGGAGDDSIDGGDGTQDVAIFYSKKENYQITRNPDTEGVDQITVRYVGNGENGEIDEGTDSLTNIELLQFADFDENNPIHTDSIAITGLPA